MVDAFCKTTAGIVHFGMAQPTAPVTFRKATRMPVGRDQLLNMLEYSIDPLVLSLSLWAVTLAYEHYLSPRYLILSLLVFALTFPGSTHLTQPLWSVVRHVALNWLAISGLLFLLGYGSGYLRYFDLELLKIWWWVAPTSQLTAHFLLRWAAPNIINFEVWGKLKAEDDWTLLSMANGTFVEPSRRRSHRRSRRGVEPRWTPAAQEAR